MDERTSPEKWGTSAGTRGFWGIAGGEKGPYPRGKKRKSTERAADIPSPCRKWKKKAGAESIGKERGGPELSVSNGAI